MSHTATASEPATPAGLIGPFDSMRDFVAAMDAHGSLLRIREMDQDRFEATGFAYRLIEEKGYHSAPAFLIERVKVDGQWLEGPVLGNIYGSWTAEALAFGAPVIAGDQRATYRSTFAHLKALYEKHGGWPRLAPTVLSASAAPCKEVIVRGADVNVLGFPWLQTNPGDAGRYLNSGSVFVEDPDLGRNVGTYRCQIKGPNKIGVNAEIGQHAWNFFMKVKKRGQKTIPAAIAVGADPIIFALGTSKLTALGEDELELAGGLRGRPVQLAKCETSELLVPAHAEMILEGEISVVDMEEEGPYGEVYGYMGLKKPSNFFMTIHAVTHRRKPWISNSFAGITKLTLGMPQLVANNVKYKALIPNLVEFYRSMETNAVALLSIDKRMPGEGLTAGQHVAAADLFAKVIIVVDKDIDVHDKNQIFHALGTRWQPNPASLMIPQTRGMPLDPSAPRRWLTSKIVIDATRQLTIEGGPQIWPLVSRVILEEQSPETSRLVASRWQEYWKDWKG